MKQINPLYVALLLLAALVVVTVKLYQSNQMQKEAIASLHETETMAKRIVALKKTWDENKKNVITLERLLKSPMLRNVEITQQKKQDRLILKAERIDKKSADYLLNKLLNGSYTISVLKIRRLGEQEASFHVEVAL